MLDLFSAAGNTSNEILAPNARVLRLVPLRTFLAVPGLVALGARWRTSHRDPLVTASACVGAVFVFALLTSHGVLGRTLPGLMLCLHTAMAVWMADHLEQRAPRTAKEVVRDPVILGAVVLLLVGLAATAPGLVRAVPRQWLPEQIQARAGPSRIEPYLALLPGPIEPGDTIVASGDLSLGAVALSGKSISPPVEPPLWTQAEIQSRADIHQELLHEDRPWNERVDLLREHHVDWLVLNPGDLDRLDVPADLIVKSQPDFGSIVRVPE